VAALGAICTSGLTPALPSEAEPAGTEPAPGFTGGSSDAAVASGRQRPLILEGTRAPSRFRIDQRGRFLRLSSPNGISLTDPRCTTLSPTALSCRTGRISYLGIRGFAGSDRIKATTRVRARLAILGGKGRDVLVGGAGDDELDGGPGRDLVFGGPGGDLLRGGAGNDRLGGGPGNDTVNGGPGRDVCSGGPGADLIIKCP
jgi:hypothetical protein